MAVAGHKHGACSCGQAQVSGRPMGRHRRPKIQAGERRAMVATVRSNLIHFCTKLGLVCSVVSWDPQRERMSSLRHDPA